MIIDAGFKDAISYTCVPSKLSTTENAIKDFIIAIIIDPELFM